MLFDLWQPENKKAFVRIYVAGTDAYIWRKSVKHTLQITDATPDFEDEIRYFLAEYYIYLEDLTTRRDLIEKLATHNLIMGKYAHLNKINQHTKLPRRKKITIVKHTNNVIQFPGSFNKKR